MQHLADIIAWFESKQPAWQSQALHELLAGRRFTGSDYARFAKLCEAAHSTGESAAPPVATVAPDSPIAGRPSSVSLVSLGEVKNVNALAPGQTLLFEWPKGMTLIYGDNASGKSGYGRILKQVCYARHRGQVRPNVFENGVGVPEATITYAIDGQQHTVPWIAGQNMPSNLQSVLVFDTHCGAFYLSSETDVRFRPFGLDVLDQMVQLCAEVEQKIQEDMKSLGQPADLSTFEPDTEVGRLLARLVSAPESEIIALASVSDEDKDKTVQLGKRIQELHDSDPKKKATELSLRRTRFMELVQKLAVVRSLCDAEGVARSATLAKNASQKAALAAFAAKEAFEGELSEVGGEVWRLLWEAARRYSSTIYPDEAFPVVRDTAKCLLCGQPIGEGASRRMTKFEDFIKDKTKQDADAAAKDWQTRLVQIQQLDVVVKNYETSIDELQVEDDRAAEAVGVFLSTSARIREAIVGDLPPEQWIPIIPEQDAVPMIEGVCSSLQERISALNEDTPSTSIPGLQVELKELAAKVRLGGLKSIICDERNRLMRSDLLHRALRDVQTGQITKHANDLTKRLVTNTLVARFEREAAGLHLDGVEVGVIYTKGVRGNSYHKVVFKKAPKEDIRDIASEGEQRCIALAAFLAELATAAESSAMVFDDPVCSLDHYHREDIAKRLVEESKVRQVIIFTHDLVFASLLERWSGDEKVASRTQYIRRNGAAAGCVEDSALWWGASVGKRVSYLKDQLQSQLTSLFKRDQHGQAYRFAVKSFCELLRETQERFLEDIMLAGIVVRFDRAVHPTNLERFLRSFDPKDVGEFQKGYTIVCDWCHDQAAALGQRVPTIQELDEVVGRIDQLRAKIVKAQKT